MAATVNSRTLLSCDAIGLPRPQVRWEKDGRVLAQAGARYVMSRSGSLQLNDVHVDDSGTYRCVAENSAGSVSRDIQLLVHGTTTLSTLLLALLVVVTACTVVQAVV